MVRAPTPNPPIGIPSQNRKKSSYLRHIIAKKTPLLTTPHPTHLAPPPTPPQFFHLPPPWLESLVSAIAFSKSAPPRTGLYRMYVAMKAATRQIPIPAEMRELKTCKHGCSTAQSAMQECTVCGTCSCCVVHKVCTRCNEGFECTCGLHARFCVALNHVVRPGIASNFGAQLFWCQI
jgi:hypothetical protein